MTAAKRNDPGISHDYVVLNTPGRCRITCHSSDASRLIASQSEHARPAAAWYRENAVHVVWDRAGVNEPPQEHGGLAYRMAFGQP